MRYEITTDIRALILEKLCDEQDKIVLYVIYKTLKDREEEENEDA